MRHSLPAILLLMLLAAACKPSVPSEVIQPGDMEDILYDYHVSQAMARNEGDYNYNRNFFFQSVLKKYGVTEAEFDSSLVYYFSHVRRLQEIYENVNERLNDEAKSLGASVMGMRTGQQYGTTGDTANIWKMQTEVMLMARPVMNRFDFIVKADTSFYKGDSFMFQFNTEFIWQSGPKDAVVCIVTHYEGDSTVQHVSHVTTPGNIQMRIPANKKQKLRDMKGFIYLDSEGDADLRRMMFVSEMQLIRFHNQQSEDDESSETDTTPTNSVQRDNNTSGTAIDTARNKTVGRGMGDRPVSPGGRAGLHRMETRSD